MVSLNPEVDAPPTQEEAQMVTGSTKTKLRPADPTNPNATGTKFHPNNQVKADYPKKHSPFSQMLKEYRYQGGEITRWFVEAWDCFSTFKEAIDFMNEQIEAKKYRSFCFQTDWPAVIDRYLFV